MTEDFAAYKTPLQQLAVMAHEMFVSLMSAGFTEDEALKLVALNMKG